MTWKESCLTFIKILLLLPTGTHCLHHLLISDQEHGMPWTLQPPSPSIQLEPTPSALLTWKPRQKGLKQHSTFATSSGKSQNRLSVYHVSTFLSFVFVSYVNSGTVDTRNRELNLESVQHGLSAQLQCTFSAKTATAPLRGHLELKHPLVYLEMLERNGWHMQSKLFKAAFSSGYLFNTPRATLSKPGANIHNLPPLPPPQPGDSMPVGISLFLKADLGAGLPKISIPVLQECLVNFIATYDEVYYYFIVLTIILIIIPRQSMLLSAQHSTGSFSYSIVIFKTQISRIIRRCANSCLQLGEGVLTLLRWSSRWVLIGL